MNLPHPHLKPTLKASVIVLVDPPWWKSPVADEATITRCSEIKLISTRKPRPYWLTFIWQKVLLMLWRRKIINIDTQCWTPQVTIMTGLLTFAIFIHGFCPMFLLWLAALTFLSYGRNFRIVSKVPTTPGCCLPITVFYHSSRHHNQIKQKDGKAQQKKKKKWCARYDGVLYTWIPGPEMACTRLE